MLDGLYTPIRTFIDLFRALNCNSRSMTLVIPSATLTRSWDLESVAQWLKVGICQPGLAVSRVCGIVPKLPSEVSLLVSRRLTGMSESVVSWGCHWLDYQLNL
jgi:cell division inhibitor SulA